MPTAGSDVDIVLQTSGSTTITGLMLARDANGSAVNYTARRMPVLPDAPLTHTQNSWHLGFGDYLARRADPHRYGFTDGVDARHPNGLQVIQNITERDFIIRNPGGERGDDTGWTHGGTGSTISDVTAQTSNVKYDTYALRMAYKTGSGTSAGILMYQELANAVNFRSATVTVGCWLRREAGSSVGAFLRVIDNASSTDSSAVDSSTWTFVEVTRTLSSTTTANSLKVQILSNGNTTGHTFDMDGMFIIFANADDSTKIGDTKPRQIVHFDGSTWLLCGGTVCEWDTATQVFQLRGFTYGRENYNFINGAVHGSRLYLSSDKDDRYSHVDTSSVVTHVTTSALHGRFFAAGIKHNGRRTLYSAGGTGNSQVRPSKEATYGDLIDAASEWGDRLDVGEHDFTITNLYWVLDSLLVGKEDGLFYFYAPDGSYRSITDQFKLIANAENFDVGMEYIDGWFYTTTARTGLIRVRFQGGDALWQPVGPRYQASFSPEMMTRTQAFSPLGLGGGAPSNDPGGPNALQFDDFGGRIRALAHDGVWMYALHDRPVADTVATKYVNLLAAKPDGEGNLIWHTLSRINVGVIGGMTVDADELWMFGTQNNTALGTARQVPHVFTMALPTRHGNMMKDATKNVETAGTKVFVTPIIDFADEGFQHDDKAWLKVELTIENIDSDQTVTVQTQIGAAIADSGGWTSVGSAITSTTANEATVAFTPGSVSVGKRCRLRFTLATDVHTDGPVIREYRVHAIPSPEQYYVWEMTCHVGTGQQLLSGQRDARTAADVIANIETLGGEDYPCKFNDLDGTQYNVNIDSWEKITLPVDVQGVGAGMATEHLEQGVRLRLREIKTS